jgi:hypothetical protein
MAGFIAAAELFTVAVEDAAGRRCSAVQAQRKC